MIVQKSQTPSGYLMTDNSENRIYKEKSLKEYIFLSFINKEALKNTVLVLHQVLDVSSQNSVLGTLYNHGSLGQPRRLKLLWSLL